MHTAQDAACCCRCSVVSACVCLLDATANPTKTAEPTEMPFGMWAQAGPGNLVLDGGQGIPTRKGSFCGWLIPARWRYFLTQFARAQQAVDVLNLVDIILNASARHVSFCGICDSRMFRLLPRRSHISAKCAYRIFYPHKLAFSTAI